MNIDPTPLPGVVVLTPRRFGDERGWFSETWSQSALAKACITLDFVQDNHSFSIKRGTLRGLHFQAPPHAQAKLIRCSKGSIFDVAVDVRVGSPTFGRWIGLELTPENGKQLLVPVGFLHGFVTRAPDTEVQYKVTDVYSRDCEGAVHWDSLGIDWSLENPPVLSEKDAAAPSFKSWQSPFYWEETQ